MAGDVLLMLLLLLLLTTTDSLSDGIDHPCSLSRTCFEKLNNTKVTKQADSIDQALQKHQDIHVAFEEQRDESHRTLSKEPKNCNATKHADSIRQTLQKQQKMHAAFEERRDEE
eukprot:8664863-Karenia_brevis.AAC.1